MQDDVNGVSWLYADLLAELGVWFYTAAINPIRGARPKPFPGGFWWEGPSGGKVLAWNGYHYLFGRSQVGDQRPGDAEAVGDNVGDVGGGVADPVDGADDLEHGGHGIGVLGRPGGQHADGPHLVDELGHLATELVDDPLRAVLVDVEHRDAVPERGEVFTDGSAHPRGATRDDGDARSRSLSHACGCGRPS